MMSEAPWLYLGVLLICNPASIIGPTPAVGILLVCFLAYVVSLIIVVRLLRPTYDALDHCFKCVLPNFLRAPHLASVYYGARFCCEVWEFVKVLYSSAYDITVAGVETVMYFVDTPLKAFIVWRLVHTWWDQYAYPHV